MTDDELKERGTKNEVRGNDELKGRRDTNVTNHTHRNRHCEEARGEGVHARRSNLLNLTRISHNIVLHTNNIHPDLFIDFYQLLYSIEGVIFGCSHFAASLA